MSAGDGVAALRSCLLEAFELKDTARAGWTRVGIDHPESVAAHSWGVALLVLTLCPPNIDRGRALAIAVLHDLAEARVGDITPHDGVAKHDKQQREHDAMVALSAVLGPEFLGLWQEYEHGSSSEGLFVKACDKLDMALTAQRYEKVADTEEFIASALSRLDEPTLRRLARSPNNAAT